MKKTYQSVLEKFKACLDTTPSPASVWDVVDETTQAARRYRRLKDTQSLPVGCERSEDQNV